MRALVVVALMACSSPFDPGSRVTRTRLLAVSADRTFARAGETVTLDALALDPWGRPLSYGWATCTPSSPTVAGCLAALDPGTVTIGAARHSIVARASYTGVAVAVCAGALTFDGAFRCTDTLDVGVKRVLIRDERNENPTLERLTFDDRDWSNEPIVDACDEDDCPQKHRIRVTVGRAEAGENTIVQFYSTEGTFSSEVRTATSPETEWVPRRRSAGTTITFAIVVRDDRGGVSFTTRTVRVRD